MLDKEILEELKQKLLEEKRRIEENISKIEAGKEADREYKTAFLEIERKPEENADEMEIYESNLVIDESMRAELKKIDAALERLEKGTYGFCLNCQKEIPLERLKAYPQAEKCLDCKK